MEKHIKENAGLEAISCKSFKKYLKSMIKGKQAYLDAALNRPSGTAFPNTARVELEYDTLNDVLDAYIYFQELKKEKRSKKGSKCRI
jgi:hypothetical protein